MRLDRNNGRGKYAIINLRKYGDYQPGSGAVRPSAIAVSNAMQTLRDAGLIEYGEPGTANEFFVIKLKDRFSAPALQAYADAVDTASLMSDDRAEEKSLDEYQDDIRKMVTRARRMPCKIPD